jgi:MtN3 and saliva related transmembrane protein
MLIIIFWIGITATCLQTVSLLPQVIEVFKNQNLDAISIETHILLTLSQLLWLIYGIYLKLWPIVISASITSLLSIIISYKRIEYMYKNKNEKKS